MIIRPSNYKDISQLVKMRFDFSMEGKEPNPELFEPFFDECSLFFEEMYESNRWKVWVAEVDGTII